VLQNVLYDIATQVFGMHIENNLQVLESIFTEANSERYGLYFDKEGKYIRATDTSGFDYKKLSMAPDQQLASLKQLRDSVYGAVTTGKGELITTQTNSGRKLLNQEVGGAYLRIMDRYYNQLFIQEKNSVVPAYSRLLFDIDKCADGTKGEWFELPHETIMT